MSILADSKIAIHKDALSRSVDGEELILHLDQGEYFGLDEVGGFVWNLLKEPITVAELVEAVTQEYDVSETTVQSDIQALLEKLLAKKLIEVS